ncbi:hypothetical protein NY414_04915 [Enterobacter hormaechei]|uniref:Lipoprotein n=1 Tax=Enterobacter asburiae TaxID=61645 RepID=A0ABC9UIT5_ENTAS|nr:MULTISPECIES: hypothetical protein [Enterobacter]EBW6336645.1 hypothetical protein [Salmonella enterica subsp. enterica serovar Oslo]MCU3011687.1 hypothetical protein [Enterobacter hormaechei subsp. hoffmannii]GHM22328.1 hypothetical protein EBZU44_08720 [Enterobacter cloacae]AZL65101.1 hypothetical protein EI562_20080 [Enterobacter asburiae]EHN8831896.1 hypothetical protein [Enterobacter hormaechei]
MKRTILACVIAATLLTGCGPKELTPEQKQEVSNLKSELSQTEKEIAAATEQQGQFTGGLIKNLTTARLEVLGTNKALLEQRINAIESGAKIDLAISGVKPDPEAAAVLKTEIDKLAVQISDAKKEASQYSGGLVQALKLSTVATQEQTMAMLQQRYLSAMYGLAEVKVPTEQANTVAAAKQTPQPSAAATNAPLLPPGEGPFGLDVGLSKKNIEDMTGEDLKPVANSADLYTSASLPKKNAEFEAYGLLISPDAGLCQIRAVGKSIDTDSFGIALKSKYEELSDSLSSIYGKADKNDFLISGSIWKEPKYWMMSLDKKERFLSAEWKGTKEKPLKNNLISVSIEARADGSEKGYIFLQYNFTNNDICKAEIEGAKKSSL